jgi:hypothetical protein
MSDALPLPSRPNLDHYRKVAKDLQLACRSQKPDAVRDWAKRLVETESEALDVRDTAWHATPLDWARHALSQETDRVPREKFNELIQLLSR